MDHFESEIKRAKRTNYIIFGFFAGLIENCEHERGMLATLGSDTSRYCFERFQEGGFDDLYGQIMAYVCSEILDARGVTPVENWSFQQSGQDWFDAFTRQNPEWQTLIPSETVH